MRDEIAIDRRFRGPPGSGNGGYVCGCLARFAPAGAVAVRLRVPPALDRALAVRRADSRAVLLDGEAVVAEARPTEVEVALPPAPSFAEAEAAARGFRGFTDHWFPGCFVCGPERAPGDGLRIFPGPLPGTERVAAPWIPDASLADERGRVASEFLWAALDCPGAFSFPPPPGGTAVVLGELAVALFGEVAARERCVLVAWQTAHEGRKHFTFTALFGETGVCRGVGRGTWIEIPQPGGTAPGRAQ